MSAEVQAWELMAFCFSLPAGDVSLHLTTFSLQYTPPVVACVCIHLACKWSNWEIPVSTDGKHWWEYVDGTVTLELLDGKFGSEVPPQRLLHCFGISVPGSATASPWAPGLAKVLSAEAASMVRQRWQKAHSEARVDVLSGVARSIAPLE